MAVDAILAAALSGLQTSQTGLTTVSNNIANVNTPGFAREVVNQAPVVVGGVGEGVSVDDIQRVTDQFLESANYQAASDAGSASIVSSLLNQAQGAFGDPSQATSYLNQLNSVFADFTAAANDPASSLPRSQTIADLTSFLNHTQAIAGTLGGLNTQADTQINGDVARINQLLGQINTINRSIATTTTSGGNAAGSQDSQSLLLQQLSSLIAINVTSGPNGTTVVRSSTGQLLVGDGGAATLSYAPSVS
jgi:flagellar hook-associated protein 1 FlgK